MKRALSIILCAVFAMLAFFPGGVMLAKSFGYIFELANYAAFAVVTAVIAVSAVILSIVGNEPVQNRVICVLTTLLAPLSLVNIGFLVYSIRAMMISVVSAGCCFYLSAKHGRPLVYKVICLILSGLMILPTLFLVFVAFIFGDMRQDMVLRSIPSPENGHYAEVVYSDQGALGGDIFVDIYEEGKDFDAVIFRISKKPQTVYPDEGTLSDIYWKNENCLVINSVEYKVNTDN